MLQQGHTPDLLLPPASHNRGQLSRAMVHNVTCRTIDHVEVCLMLLTSAPCNNRKTGSRVLPFDLKTTHPGLEGARDSFRAQLPTNKWLISELLRLCDLIRPATWN